ncbi:MAG TPA: HD domain-containing protein [Solirubrobacteraceae bacterium]|jgi:3'-5' exoribonuclease|nr:HD domain-containing protein [Solirubrobacteraceae bacterium]
MASATYSSTERAQSVATLRASDEVDGVFACTRKERQLSRAGTPYLTLELRDSTGTILARAFRDADLLAGRFERGELVRVRGRVERFRDQLQIDVGSIVRADGPEADPARFLPVAYRDLDELEGFLEHLAREVYDPGLKGLLERLLGEPKLRAEIRRAPCSAPASAPGGRPSGGNGRAASLHHAYLGGLLEHTVAVATLAVELCALHPRLDRDLLLTAAIVHDLGKTREYSYGAEISRSREGRLLGHIELGMRLIAEHASADLASERRLALEHCVLMHHGPDAASAQRFATAEALALFRLNALDAHLKGAFEQGFPALDA